MENLLFLLNNHYYNSEIVMKSKEYAVACHKNVNQFYDGQPYSIHLDLVAFYSIKFSYILEKMTNYDTICSIIASSYTHDLIEDTRETYNDVLNNTNKIIADITFAVTDEKGRNRNERKNEKYYRELLDTPFATYIKICDRLANVYYSKNNGHKMLKVYLNEHQNFKTKLYKEEYNVMFDELEKSLK